MTISSATSGASIRYTLDGTDPSSSAGTLYVGPISVTATTTIRAIAYAGGMLDSPISEAIYVIGESADTLIEAAYQFMRDGDWDAALDAFSQALIADPTNGEAGIGYAVLNVAAITVDPDVVETARDRLGLVDYPDDMGTLLSPSWLVDMYAESGGTWYGLFPNIEGQDDWSDYDGDPAFVDPVERLLALASFVAANNPTGPSAILATVSSALSERLQAAIDAINAVGDDFAVTVDWQMADAGNDTAPPSWWPTDGSDPVEFVIGKAEALQLAGFLGVVRTLAEIAQVYDLTLPLEEYWNSFGPGTTAPLGDVAAHGLKASRLVPRDADAPAGTPPDDSKPFSGEFLNLSAESEAHLQAARSAWVQAAEETRQAVDLLIEDRPGFTLSSDTEWLFPTSDSWDGFVDTARIVSRAAQEQQESLEDSRMAVFPKSDFDPDNWPVAPLDPATEIGVNLYLFFDAPVGLATALMEIKETADSDGPNVGEPVFYTLDVGGPRPLTYADVNALGGATGGLYDFRGAEETYYMRAVDVTLNGVIPIANIPLDDPATRSTLDLSIYDNLTPDGFWTWNDDNEDGLYQSGEGEDISSAWIVYNVEGPIDTASIATEYGGDPAEWYSLTDTALDEHLAAPTAEYRQALLDAIEDGGWDLDDSYTFTFLDGNSVYIGGLTIDAIWQAYTVAGTDSAYLSYFDSETPDPAVVSQGSVYWGLADALFP